MIKKDYEFLKYSIFLKKRIIIGINFRSIIIGFLIRLIKKSKMPEYLKIMEWKLIDMLSTPTFVRKINNANYKGYLNQKSNEGIDGGDTGFTETIFDCFQIKSPKN